VEENRCDGTKCAGGSRASGGRNSAESVDIGGNGDSQRQNSDKIIQKLCSTQEIAVLGESFLEPWILREYIGAG